jgi:hypothetical protein
MLPQRDDRLAAAFEPDDSALLALPPALVLVLFSLLPVDARARCAAVCRAWRAALVEPSLWQHLDLSDACGVSRRMTAALLAGAAARAGGTLRTLDVSGFGDVSAAALRAVVTANAATLREMRLGEPAPDQHLLDCADLMALLQAAPLLCVSNAGAACPALETACRVLRNEGTFERLRLRRLCLFEMHHDAAGEEAVLALAAAISSHASLTFLQVDGVLFDTAVKLNALADAVVRQRLTALWLTDCGLTRACAPALARLCASSTLTELGLDGDGAVLEDVATGLVVADALRANTTLTELSLERLGMWRDPAVGTALLGALTGHRSVRVLVLCGMFVPAAHEAAAGAALGALVAANSPALHELAASWSGFGDEGWGPLVDALPGNTHLRKLNLADDDEEGQGISEAFARDRLLPAVRANASLRKLDTDLRWAGAREAEVLVWQRAAADE